MAWKWLKQLEEKYPHLAERAKELNMRDHFVMKYDPVETERREREERKRKEERKKRKQEEERKERKDVVMAEVNHAIERGKPSLNTFHLNDHGRSSHVAFFA